MKVLHLINSGEVRRGGAQKILMQIISADSHSQRVFSILGDGVGDFTSRVLWPLRFCIELFKFRPTVLVAHSRNFLPVIFFLEAIFGIKVVFLCHSVFVRNNWLFSIFKVNRYIAISCEVERNLRLVVGDADICLIFNGVDVRNQPLKTSRSARCQTIDFAYIGSLNRIKGVDVAIEALGNFSIRNNVKVNFHVVGEGEEMGSLKSTLKVGSLNTIFHGYLENPFDVIEDVENLIVPSLQEGFCLVLVEAVINRKVVFASDLPVLVEVASGASSVKFFETGSAKSLCDSLCEYSSGKKISSAQVLKSSINLSRTYSLEGMQKKYLTYFKSQ